MSWACKTVRSLAVQQVGLLAALNIPRDALNCVEVIHS
jgi:hypothetical protein